MQESNKPPQFTWPTRRSQREICFALFEISRGRKWNRCPSTDHRKKIINNPGGINVPAQVLFRLQNRLTLIFIIALVVAVCESEQLFRLPLYLLSTVTRCDCFDVCTELKLFFRGAKRCINCFCRFECSEF